MTDFQASVRYDLAFGVPGEIKYDGPSRAHPGLIYSASAAYNIVGATVFTQAIAGGLVAAGGAIGAVNTFFGILAKPKSYASLGTSALGPLAPTLTLANYTEAEFLQMGYIVASVPAACNIGDLVVYNTTTGAISTIKPFTSFTGEIATVTGVLTVSAIASGYIQTGMTLTGTNVVAGTRVTGQVTGTPGSTGTYNTNVVAAVASTTDMATPNYPASGYGFVPGAVVEKFAQTAAGGLALLKLTN